MASSNTKKNGAPIGTAKFKSVHSHKRITFYVSAVFERQYEGGPVTFEKEFFIKDDGWQVRIETVGGNLLGIAYSNTDSARAPHPATALELVRKYLAEHEREF